MRCKKIVLPVLLLLILAVSCGSKPEAITSQDTQEMVLIQFEDTFNPETITHEEYLSTREDVQRFMEELNQIIRRRNYNGWRAALSTEYFENISSPENLQRLSELPAMRTRNIVLRTPEDYFRQVVVPSRANSRVDDIEFISRNRVKAFTVRTNRDGAEERLLLYNLERIGDVWKIIN
jgi:PHD/YefM family antitoxin component YafN of YafNO toxin-antitoxin module